MSNIGGVFGVLKLEKVLLVLGCEGGCCGWVLVLWSVANGGRGMYHPAREKV